MTVVDLLQSQDLPVAHAGVFTLVCSGPRRDGRFGLHVGSPSSPPFALAWHSGSEWEWQSAAGDRHGTAPTLDRCLTTAFPDAGFADPGRT